MVFHAGRVLGAVGKDSAVVRNRRDSYPQQASQIGARGLYVGRRLDRFVRHDPLTREPGVALQLSGDLVEVHASRSPGCIQANQEHRDHTNPEVSGEDLPE